MRGIVDQLELNDDDQLIIVEHKTRRHQSLPSDSQKRGACMQVMMYCYLLNNLEALLEGAQLGS